VSLNQAEYWVAVLARDTKPPNRLTDRITRGLLTEAAVASYPVGFAGTCWVFADKSTLIRHPGGAVGDKAETVPRAARHPELAMPVGSWRKSRSP
jgi:hypothetical protein